MTLEEFIDINGVNELPDNEKLEFLEKLSKEINSYTNRVRSGIVVPRRWKISRGDYSGMVYPNGTKIIKQIGIYGRNAVYECLCHCGNMFQMSYQNIRYANTKAKRLPSCGCDRGKTRKKPINIKSEKIIKDQKLYARLMSLRSRYTHELCDEWKDKSDNNVGYRRFYDWSYANGYDPNKSMRLRRIDRTCSFSPDNCRWLEL